MKIVTIGGLRRALGTAMGQIAETLEGFGAALNGKLSKTFLSDAGYASTARLLTSLAINAGASQVGLFTNLINPANNALSTNTVYLPTVSITTAGTVTPALWQGWNKTSTDLASEITARQNADAALLPRSVAGMLLTHLASYANGTTVLLRKQSVSPANGALEDIYEAMPVVDAETAGICPPTLYVQVVQMAQDVEALKGRRLYYPAALDTDSPDDAQLTSIVETAGGELLDGVTINDFTYKKDYTWYAATDSWHDRGSSVMAIATNASVGAVRGRNEPGYCVVDPDGSLPLAGWDATQEAISALQSAMGGKQGVIAMPANGKLAGMTPAQAFQYLSEWLDDAQKSDVRIKVSEIDVV